MPTSKKYQVTNIKVFTIQALESLIAERKAEDASPHTITYYFRENSYFITWLATKSITTMDEITTQLIRDYLSDLGTHRNKGGVFASFRAIRTFLNFYESEYEPQDWQNPIKKVKVQIPKIQPMQGISIEDVQKMISAVTGRNTIRDKAIIHCLVSSGCRASEFLNLNIEDVDLVTGAVKIQHGKGDKFRITFFGREARKALRKYLAIHPFDNQIIWLNDEQERLSISGLRHLVLKYSRLAGIKTPGLHDFRRCFAISCYRKGVEILIISQLLGHTSVEITKRYLNINQNDLRIAHIKGNPLD